MADSFNGVIDLSHHTARPDLSRAKDDGIVGVFQKAMQGPWTVRSG